MRDRKNKRERQKKEGKIKQQRMRDRKNKREG